MQAMATTLTEANRAAHAARAQGADRLDEATLKQIRSRCLGALARGETTPTANTPPLPTKHAPSSHDSAATKT